MFEYPQHCCSDGDLPFILCLQVFYSLSSVSVIFSYKDAVEKERGEGAVELRRCLEETVRVCESDMDTL